MGLSSAAGPAPVSTEGAAAGLLCLNASQRTIATDPYYNSIAVRACHAAPYQAIDERTQTSKLLDSFRDDLTPRINVSEDSCGYSHDA